MSARALYCAEAAINNTLWERVAGEDIPIDGKEVEQLFWRGGKPPGLGDGKVRSTACCFFGWLMTCWVSRRALRLEVMASQTVNPATPALPK